jgi:hypothetical protein
MYFVFGTGLFGKVDHVPGLFYVVTRFVHVNYLPVGPDQTYLIMDDGTGNRGVPIQFSVKSMLMAWFRAGCFVLGPILAFGGFVVWTMQSPNRPGINPISLIFWILGPLLIQLGILSYFVIRIGRDRAVDLAEAADLDPIFVHDHFDRLEGKTRPDPESSNRAANSRLEKARKRWNDSTGVIADE